MNSGSPAGAEWRRAWRAGPRVQDWGWAFGLGGDGYGIGEGFNRGESGRMRFDQPLLRRALLAGRLRPHLPDLYRRRPQMEYECLHFGRQ